MLGSARRSLEEQHAFFFGELTGLFSGYDLVLSHIGLVAHQDQQSPGVGIIFSFIKPEVLDALEAFEIGDIVDQDDGVGTCVN